MRIHRPNFGPIRPWLLTVGLVTAGALALTGCATGTGAQTQQTYQPGVGQNSSAGSMLIRAVVLVRDPANPDRAVMLGQLINNGGRPDSLAAVSVSRGQTVGVVALPTTGLVVPVRIPVNLSGTDRTTLVTGLKDMPTGGVVLMTMRFAAAGNTPTFDVKIVSATDEYSSSTPTSR